MFDARHFALAIAGMCSISTMGQTVTTITEELNAAGDLEVGPDGNVYVADFGRSLNGGADGTMVYRVTPTGELSVFASGLSGASGNAFDSDGNLYQSNIAASRISKITPDGTVSTLTSGPGVAGPVGVAVDADGNVYNTNCGADTITKTTQQGTTTLHASSTLFSCPNGLTIDDDGTLYTSNFNNCNVMKVTQDGTVSRVGCASTFGAPNGGNGHITYANERLYVAGWRGGVIFEMPLDGSPVSVLAGAGGSGRSDGPAMEAKFHQPNGIDATPDGDTLYVNDTVNLLSQGVELHPNVVRMITGVKREATAREDERPAAFEIHLVGTYPNPVTALANVEYLLPDTRRIRLEVADQLGRRVALLDEGIRAPGRHKVAFDAARLPSGSYVVRITSPTSIQSSLLVVVH